MSLIKGEVSAWVADCCDCCIEFPRKLLSFQFKLLEDHGDLIVINLTGH